MLQEVLLQKPPKPTDDETCKEPGKWPVTEPELVPSNSTQHAASPVLSNYCNRWSPSHRYV